MAARPRPGSHVSHADCHPVRALKPTITGPPEGGHYGRTITGPPEGGHYGRTITGPPERRARYGRTIASAPEGGHYGGLAPESTFRVRARTTESGFRIRRGRYTELAMIPLRDVIPTRTFPALVVGIIGLNALAFLFEQTLQRSPARALRARVRRGPRRFGVELRVHVDVPARRMDAPPRQHAGFSGYSATTSKTDSATAGSGVLPALRGRRRRSRTS